MNKLLFFTGLLSATIAAAGQRSDYAQEWPLRLSRDDGGAFRVVLSAEIYAGAHQSALADIEVFNAAGESLPAALLGAQDAVARAWPAQTLDVRWFQLPPSTDAVAPLRWNVRTERDAQGRLVRVDSGTVDGDTVQPRNEILLDLSQIRAPLSALRFEWKTDAEPFRIDYALASSSDLHQWSTRDHAVLADLRNGDERLRRDRIELNGASWGAYLRLLPTQADQQIALTRVVAELSAPAPEPEWRWEDLRGQRIVERDRVYYDFTLPSRLPAQQIDVVAAASNSAAEWTVHSRDSEKAVWTLRAGPWTGYQVSAAGSVENSTPQQLYGPVRDRYWRVESAQALSDSPRLRIGYRPEVIVFLAQGDAPFSIAAGSAMAHRRDAPITSLLDALRRRHGADWQPYPALPESRRALAGAAALVPPVPAVKPIDWRSWLLWGLLGGSTLVVAAMAFSLLRKPSDTPGD